MLKAIRLTNVGPAPGMNMDLAPRLNILTGDNGLGKSFLLDVAWWVLTRTWATKMMGDIDLMALPKPGAKATIGYEYTTKTGRLHKFTSEYDATEIQWTDEDEEARRTDKAPKDAQWTGKQGRPPIPGLVLYVQVDGGFSVWDPTRNYWKENATDRPDAFRFAPAEVWDGKKGVCNGLIRDWPFWQASNDHSFAELKRVLKMLSPSRSEPLMPGKSRRVIVEDPRHHPTLRMPYGGEVPVIHASAGMRRIIALAYLLTWAWRQHVENANLRGEDPTHEIIFLIDELEGHLHPQWQRRIVPSLLKVMDALTGKHKSKVQVLAATHSPLIMASLEPFFNNHKDAWFDLDLERRKVVLQQRDYIQQGEVGNWLISDAFDLKVARSLKGEKAILKAEKQMQTKVPSPKAIAAADKALREAGLPDIDTFWVRWRYFRDRHMPEDITKQVRRKR